MNKELEKISFWLLLAVSMVALIFSACNKDDGGDQIKDPLTYDKGVVINGVKWATRNVDAPGSFTSAPEDGGMFYQWNRKGAWVATENAPNWNNSTPVGDTWEKSNDPSPVGWRVPVSAEILKLLDTKKVINEWTTINDVNGRKFTDKATGNYIFLPAAGYRNNSDGMLYMTLITAMLVMIYKKENEIGYKTAVRRMGIAMYIILFNTFSIFITRS